VVGLRSCLWGDGKTGDMVGVEGLVNELKALPKDPSDPQSYRCGFKATTLSL